MTSDNVREISRLKKNLALEFEIKDLGTLFLRMEFARPKEGIVVSQGKYILDLLKDTGIGGCKPIETPIDPHMKLGKGEGNQIDATIYQRLVGRQIYLSLKT